MQLVRVREIPGPCTGLQSTSIPPAPAAACFALTFLFLFAAADVPCPGTPGTDAAPPWAAAAAASFAFSRLAFFFDF